MARHCNALCEELIVFPGGCSYSMPLPLACYLVTTPSSSLTDSRLQREQMHGQSEKLRARHRWRPQRLTPHIFSRYHDIAGKHSLRNSVHWPCIIAIRYFNIAISAPYMAIHRPCCPQPIGTSRRKMSKRTHEGKCKFVRFRSAKIHHILLTGNVDLAMASPTRIGSVMSIAQRSRHEKNIRTILWACDGVNRGIC